MKNLVVISVGTGSVADLQAWGAVLAAQTLGASGLTTCADIHHELGDEGKSSSVSEEYMVKKPCALRAPEACGLSKVVRTVPNEKTKHALWVGNIPTYPCRA